MVRARLHIVCGNCGEIATNTRDDNKNTTLLCRQGKYIYCANCGTLHYINDVLPTEQQIEKRHKNTIDKFAEQKDVK